MDRRTDLQDLETNSPAFVIVRRLDSAVALGFGIEADGDFDLVLSDEDVRKLIATLSEAVESASG